jgi:hypothetical protein
MNHLKRDFATQVGVERFVGDAHGAAAKLNWRAIITGNQLVLVKTVRSASAIDIIAA